MFNTCSIVKAIIINFDYDDSDWCDHCLVLNGFCANCGVECNKSTPEEIPYENLDDLVASFNLKGKANEMKQISKQFNKLNKMNQTSECTKEGENTRDSDKCVEIRGLKGEDLVMEESERNEKVLKIKEMGESLEKASKEDFNMILDVNEKLNTTLSHFKKCTSSLIGMGSHQQLQSLLCTFCKKSGKQHHMSVGSRLGFESSGAGSAVKLEPSLYCKSNTKPHLFTQNTALVSKPLHHKSKWADAQNLFTTTSIHDSLYILI
jgi:hypothetical protein